ncbi:MAG: RNA polymerase sigma factor [Thermodesulfobacteriota bacterium]
MDGMDRDSNLVRKIKNGSDRAFRELVERYQKTAFSFCLHLTGNYDDAQDISQDAFAKVYLKIKGFREESLFKTWFFKIIVNLCRNYHRKKRFVRFLPLYKEERDAEKYPILMAKDDVEANVINRERITVVRNAVDNLPSRQKEVFVMKHMEGLKISEIAGVLNCAEGTVKANLFKAVNNLKEGLKDKR